MLLLGRDDIEELLEPAATVAAVEAALIASSRGEVLQPLRTVLDLPSSAASALFMPAVLPAADALGTKLVTIYPQNRRLGLPTHHGAVLLCDAATGRPTALLEGAALTAVRTAAVTALATRLLARSDTRRLAVLGTGIQAESHLPFLLAERDFTSVAIWSPQEASRQRFAQCVETLVEVPLQVCDTAEEAVRGADVILTATAAADPVVARDWIEPGAHLNAIGASTATRREIDGPTVAASRLFVEQRAAALAEAGDLLLAIEAGLVEATHIVAELGEVAVGDRPGRRSDDEITLFKSVGLAIEDLAVARLAVDRAGRLDLGRRVDW
ncbi:MAG: ornithine cyclodeaminase family protein [Thermoanaerobaculia bacterium]|nr:ornithine cyclodeaminase family protein [Thermoanaerobaculia bacterium]